MIFFQYNKKHKSKFKCTLSVTLFHHYNLIFILLLIIYQSIPVDALGLVPSIYCGLKTCYDILSVNRDSTKNEIKKAYRNLSQKLHPDKFISALNSNKITKEEYEEIEIKFRTINIAYETLKSEASKEDYNHYLDHPEDRYYNYYRYYSNKYKPNVDVRLVILGFLLCWSIFQWSGWTSSYNQVIFYMQKDNKYRMQAKRIAIEKKLLDEDGKLSKKLRRTEFKNPDLAKKEVERILKSIIEQNVDVRGGYGKPKITDVAIFQVIFLPKYIYEFIKSKYMWWYRRKILKVELNESEKWTLIQKNLKCKSLVEFEYLKDKKGLELWNNECWDADKCEVFQAKLKEEQRLKDAESGSAKQYRRYIKKHGTGKMTFNENDDGEWED